MIKYILFIVLASCSNSELEITQTYEELVKIENKIGAKMIDPDTVVSDTYNWFVFIDVHLGETEPPQISSQAVS